MSNILIVGASSGVGKSLATRLSEHGHEVYGTFNKTDIDNQAIKSFSLDVTVDSPNFGFLPDVLDGIVYCPGSINLKPFHRMTPDSFLADYALQVVGAVKVLQAGLPALKKSESPSVVLFSTVAVQSGYNFHSQVASSKGGVEGLTRALAAEWSPTIRVNCIAPSLTDTPLARKLLSTEEKREANAQRHPLKKIGQPENIADMAEFLLSNKSSWITGQIMHVDGGMSSINH